MLASDTKIKLSKSAKTISDNEFLSLKEYKKLARQTVAYLAPKHYYNLTKELYRNNDMMSNFATEIMIADWLYDKNRKKRCKLITFRMNRCHWLLCEYLRNKKKTKQEIYLDEHWGDGYDRTMIQKTYGHNNDNDTFLTMIDYPFICGFTKQCLILYFQYNLTYKQIAKQYGITKHTVRVEINNGLNQIKNLLLNKE
jgi:hypothetical protein